MKKLILAILIASVFAGSAMAGTTSVDVYADHVNTSRNGNLQGLKLKHALDFGTEFSI